MNTMEQSGSTRWIGPHRFETEAPIPEECSVWLKSVSRRATRRTLLLWALVPLPCVLSAVASGVLRSTGAEWLLVVGLIGTCVLIGAAWIVGMDSWFRIRQPACAALKAGVVHRFRLDARVKEELAAARAIGRPPPDYPETIEIYPTVARMARVDERMIVWGSTAKDVVAVSVAEAPASAVQSRTERRRLTPDEIEELHRWRKRLRMPPIPGLCIVLILVSGGAYLMVVNALARQHPVLVGLEVLLTLCLPLGVRNRFMMERVRKRLAMDILGQEVHGLSGRSLNEWMKAHDPKAPQIIEWAELLPNADRLWTVDGAPAPWRLQPKP